MSIALIRTRASTALQAPSVIVEIHLSNGLPAFNLVGLPETAVRESKDRVRSAIINSRFEFPAKRITVNLAPADLPKEGGRYDLAIALGVLIASGQLKADNVDHLEFLGELALTGELRPIKGVLNAALACCKEQHILITPKHNAHEASIAAPQNHLFAEHLLEICCFLEGQAELDSHQPIPAVAKARNNVPDMQDIKGQHQAKRALEIAAAGGHNLLYSGPPGCGKSMLAQRLAGILPTMSKQQALSQLAIQSITGGINLQYDWMRRPFRSPHHSSSAAALVGGGNPPSPGEISLAHQGVLFLDELPEFQRPVLEALREPMETGYIHISRANQQTCFPANFQLIAAMNPCPCGYHGEVSRSCYCSAQQILRYTRKISGPLLDRIDIQLKLQPTPVALLSQQNNHQEESSKTIRQRIERAQQYAIKRQTVTNAQLDDKQLRQISAMNPKTISYLEQLADKLQLSARAFQRSIKVARTIADLEQSPTVQAQHIAEACGYRIQISE